ncbi:hypothetical protein EGW08_021386 [Elysia chlorotica]|uniref:Uncharacterized protein n=1 Tax=Elysia chlorotica TaxID=188477 RepID=A0A3S1AYZ8_ELYCH|nr:hypothetical protein EGW08_021386 [Elysia chlorotica]
MNSMMYTSHKDKAFFIASIHSLTCQTYKPPSPKDIPIDWRIHLLPNTPNPSGIHSSKACGEPPITLSSGVLLANKKALESARQELFGKKDFVTVDAPFTPEKAQQSVGIDESALMM